MIAYAADGAHVTAAKAALVKINEVILFPLMTLMIAIALLVFLWGAFEFVSSAASDEGQMMYGIIGLLVMISAYAILKIAAGTFGCDITTAGGCGSI
jgi:hypothetical protein